MLSPFWAREMALGPERSRAISASSATLIFRGPLNVALGTRRLCFPALAEVIWPRTSSGWVAAGAAFARAGRGGGLPFAGARRSVAAEGPGVAPNAKTGSGGWSLSRHGPAALLLRGLLEDAAPRALLLERAQGPFQAGAEDHELADRVFDPGPLHVNVGLDGDALVGAEEVRRGLAGDVDSRVGQDADHPRLTAAGEDLKHAGPQIIDRALHAEVRQLGLGEPARPDPPLAPDGHCPNRGHGNDNPPQHNRPQTSPHGDPSQVRGTQTYRRHHPRPAFAAIPPTNR